MKLRIRHNIEKHLIQFDDDVKTINELRSVISAKIRDLPLEYSLSLDGISTIDEEESGLISDIGLVSGDLVHILPTAQYDPEVIQSHNLHSVIKENEEKKQEFSKLFASPSETTLTGRAEPMDFDDHEVKMANSQGSLDSSVLMADNDDDLLCQSVDLVTSRFNKSPPSPQLKLAVAVLHLMTELGFKYVDRKKVENEEEDEEDVDAIRMSFSHPSFELLTFETFLVTMVNKSILHGISKEGGMIVQKDSLNFDLDHLFGKDFSRPTKRDLSGVLRKQFRDQIGNKMIQSALRAHGFREMAELSNLPFEVQLKVLNLLKVSSILRLSETSKFWRTLCMEPLVWKKKYLELMSSLKQPAATPSSSESWFELYKRQYKLQKEKSKFREFMFPRPEPQPLHNRSPFFPPPYPALPGVIGGRYDIYPGAGHPDFEIFQPIGGPFMGGGGNPLMGPRGGRGRRQFPDFNPPNFPGFF